MKNFLFLAGFALCMASSLQAQYILKGLVLDHEGEALTGAVILADPGSFNTLSNSEGRFSINGLASGVYTLEVRFVGFRTYYRDVDVNSDTFLEVRMEKSLEELEEVVVTDDYGRLREKMMPAPIEVVEENYLLSQRAGSLMKTLERLPGVRSMNIAGGQSKPQIRGLGFQRIVVAENGIKHESQQWGRDHGLEIDQFSASHIEIIKGPASVQYGSDAIGGVIHLKDRFIPRRNVAGIRIESGFQGNNELFNVSGLIYGRTSDFYAKLRFTASEYSDLRVPADSIAYYSYYFRLKDQRLRNTAGEEGNYGITLGYEGNRWKGRVAFSRVGMKSGFFANAHGLEIRRSKIDYDRSFRDIDLPYQDVTHYKIMTNHSLRLNYGVLNIDAGWQSNIRKEFSEAIGHGEMPDPPDSLERKFDKNVFDLNTSWTYSASSAYRFQTGINLSAEQNRIGGWGYIFPEYRFAEAGFFLINRWELNNKIHLTGSIRYDRGRMKVSEYRDWYTTTGDSGTSDIYRQRAPEIEKIFQAWTGSVGMVSETEHFLFKTSLGRSFRFPNAKELASEGINYHVYRFEIGDSSLNPETAWQADFEFRWTYPRWALQVNPYAGYFPNFIFLAPGYLYREGLQEFYYTQNKVLRTGGELHFHYRLSTRWKTGMAAEYVYARQLSGDKKGFGLPFAPPFSAVLNLKFLPPDGKRLSNTGVSADLRLTASQNETLPPELPTPGYYLVNLAFHTDIQLFKDPWSLSLRVENLFNHRYYDHTGYYRLVGIPEPGRFFSAHLRIPIERSLKK